MEMEEVNYKEAIPESQRGSSFAKASAEEEVSLLLRK
jgi:hypothetical protein